MAESFKTCPMCHRVWETQEDFVSDSTLELNGYTVNFKRLEGGMFFFTHTVEDCRTTMGMEVSQFLNLYTGVHYSEQRAGKEDCPGYCLNKEQLDRCNAVCECAFVREICNVIRQKQGN